jgi:hypothetical protein
MAEQSFGEHFDRAMRRYEEEHAYSEEAAIEFGELMASLPEEVVGHHNRFTYLDREQPRGDAWGIEVCWDSSNGVYSAITLFEHQHDEDCDSRCNEEWDSEPFDAEKFKTAVMRCLITDTQRIRRETEQLREAIDAFSSKRIGFAELRKAVQ